MLFWPLVLLFAGIRRSRWIAIAGSAGVAIWRYFHWAYYASHYTFGFRTEVRADALLCGCLLALLLTYPRVRGFLMRWTRVAVWPAAAILLYCMFRFQALVPLYECAAVAILIAATTLHPEALLARCLSFKPLVWLGIVSYGVYVWQQLFVYLHASLLFSTGVLLPITVLTSYEYLEKPCMRLGRKLSRNQVTKYPVTT